ncbi:MAG: hypothetical protein NT069_15170 [Planctomycetota bacterium]|nr:hypothetical protein [Planctomycetota bacterium]
MTKTDKYVSDDDSDDNWSDETWTKDSKQELDDSEDADDEDDDGGPCPYCGIEIAHDAPQCPHCKNYITEEENAGSRQPWWIVATVIVCLLMVYFWMFGWPG